MKVYLGLGSNIGDSANHIKEAINAISQYRQDDTGGQVISNVKSSSLYCSRAQNMVDQDDFINAVVELNTSLSAHRVLEMCQAIEQRVRSTKAIRFGPRILDVDLLLYGQQMINDAPQLIVPHPRMHERRFVIEPLIELMGNQALLTVSNHIINDNNEMIERSMASTTKTLSDCFSDVMHQACVKITTPII